MSKGKSKQPADSSSRAPGSVAGKDAGPAPAGADGGGKPPAPPRKRRWLRRLLVAFAVLWVLRIVLLAALPSILDGVAEGQGLRLDYERLELSLVGMDLELWHLEVAPREAPAEAEPLLHLEYVRADVAVLHLLIGDLVVRRAEVDGLDVALEIDEDGRLVGLPEPAPSEPGDATDDAAAEADDAGASDDDESSDDEAEPTSLVPPLALDALRVQQLRVRVLDRSVTPPLSTRLRGEVRLSNLGSESRATRLDVLLSADGVLDSLRVDGLIATTRDRATLDLDVSLRGLRPASVAGYLAPAGIEAEADTIELGLALQAELLRPDPERLPLRLAATLSDVRVLADGTPSLTLERVDLALPHLDDERVHVQRVEVGPLRADATRRADGRLSVAGLLLGGPTAPSAPSDEPEPDTDEPPAGPGRDLRVDLLRVADVRAQLRDESHTPPSVLAFVLDELSVRDIDSSDPSAAIGLALRAHVPDVLAGLDIDGEARPFGDDGSARLDVALSGLAPHGLQPYLAAAGVGSSLQAGSLGLTLDAGWSSTADGGRHAEASITGLRLRDGERELLSLGEIVVSGVSLPGEAGGPVRVDELTMSGTELPAHKDAEGRVHVAGFVLGGVVPPTAPPAAADGAATPAAAQTAPTADPVASGAAPAAAPSATPAGPAFELGALRWTGTRLSWHDASMQPPLDVRVPSLDLSVEDLVLDTSASFPLAASLVVRLGVEGLLDELLLTGQVAPQADAASVGAELVLRGLHGEYLRALLSESGLEPELVDGRLELGIDGSVALADGETRLALDLADLSLRDGGAELFAWDLLRLGDTSLGADVHVGEVRLVGPRLHARRDADGSVHVLGVRVPPPAPAGLEPAGDATASGAPAATETAAAAPAASASADTTADAAVDTTADATTQPADDAAPASALRLDLLAVEGLAVRWSDAAVDPPADLALRTDLTLTDVAPGPGAGPATLVLSLGLPGLLETLSLTGELVPDPLEPSAQLTLKGRIPGYEPLLGYLPPGITATGEPVSLDAELTAKLEPAVDGGRHVDVKLTGFGLRDTNDRGVGVASVAFLATRLDPAAGVIEIEDASITGVQLDAAKDADGALRVLGLAIGSAPTPPAEIAQAGASDTLDAADDASVAAATGTSGEASVAALSNATGEAGEPSAVAPAATQPSVSEPGPPTDASLASADPAAGDAAATDDDEQVVPPAFPSLPQLTVAKLGLHVEHLRLVDLAHPEAPPLAVRDLHLGLDAPLQIDRGDPEMSPPVSLSLRAGAAPILDELELQLTAEPFAVEPTLALVFDAVGLHGAALTEVLPDLAASLDASGLVDGRIHAALEASLGGRRRHPLEFIPSSGVSLDLVVHDIGVRDGPEGELLVGLKELRVEAPRIVPELNLVHVRNLEISRPVAHVVQSARGMQIANVVLLAPPPEPADEGTEGEPTDGAGGDAASVGQPADDALAAAGGDAMPADEDAADDDATPGARAPRIPAPSATAPPAGPPLDLRLDSLLVGGIDVSLRDETASPPLLVPVTELDVSVQGFSTKALVEPLPVRFQVLLGLGDVPDPRSTDEEPRDALPLVSEISLDGRLSLAPHPVGWAKASIDALELVGFKGPAAGAGVKIEEGSLDARVDLRFADDGALDTRNRFVFRDLDLSEPENGLISSVLALPAPLDTVVFLLRDETGAIDIPLNVSVGADGLSLGEITTVATATLGRLIGNAVASSPLRVAGGLGDAAMFMGGLVGLADDEVEDVVEEPPTPVHFAPVDTLLDSAARASLDALAARLDDDDGLMLTLRHELGARDLAEAGLRSSPPPETCEQLVARLRARKGLLLATQSLLADEVRAAHATGLTAASREATRRLLDAERELGLIERALDGVLDVLRPGSETRGVRRTRDACQSVAGLRLDEVRHYLLNASDIEDIGRVRILRPRFSDSDLDELGAVSVTPGQRLLP